MAEPVQAPHDHVILMRSAITICDPWTVIASDSPLLPAQERFDVGFPSSLVWPYTATMDMIEQESVQVLKQFRCNKPFRKRPTLKHLEMIAIFGTFISVCSTLPELWPAFPLRSGLEQLTFSRCSIPSCFFHKCHWQMGPCTSRISAGTLAHPNPASPSRCRSQQSLRATCCTMERKPT